MALDLFCYTSLEPDEARSALESLRVKGVFDYDADFAPSLPRLASKDAQDIAYEFTASRPKTLFLVRLSNKSMLAAHTVNALVDELKSGFSDLLVLWEDERAL